MKHLIVNADDFGASSGINRAVADCHVNGIVTSASLMVTASAAEEAAALARDHPALSIGLHWDVFGEEDRPFDTDDVAAVRDEFARQLDAFHGLIGRAPTHVDSHQHVHRYEHLVAVFAELVEPLGVPLRGDGRVRYVGGFYAQWEWGVTNLEHVHVPFLERLLREEVGEGWTELGCHPGYPAPGFRSVYGDDERAAEARTLTDPHVRETIDELDVALVSYADYAVAHGQPAASG